MPRQSLSYASSWTIARAGETRHLPPDRASALRVGLARPDRRQPRALRDGLAVVPVGHALRSTRARQLHLTKGETLHTVNLHWKLPLHIDALGMYIFDADNNMVAQLRGWGHLTGVGGLRLDPDFAKGVQIARGQAIVDAVNCDGRLR